MSERTTHNLFHTFENSYTSLLSFTINLLQTISIMNKVNFHFILLAFFLLKFTDSSATDSDCNILNPYADAHIALDQQIGQSFVACQTGTIKSIAVLVHTTTSLEETINIYDGTSIDPLNLIGTVTGQTLTANGGDNSNLDVTDFSAEGVSVVSGQSYTFDIPTGANLVVTLSGAYASGDFYMSGVNTNDPNLDLVFEVIIEPIAEPDIPTVTTTNEIVTAGNSIDLNITGALNSATAWHVYSGSCGTGAVTSNASNTISVSPGSGISTYYIRGEGGGATPGDCGSVTVYAQGTLTTTYTGGAWNNGTPNGAYHSIIDQDYTSTGDLDAYSLTVNSDKSLHLDGHTLNLTDELILKSNAVFLDEGTTNVGGSQKIERLMNTEAVTDFHLLSVPIANGNYEDSFQGSYIYRYVGGEYDHVYSFENGVDMIAGEGISVSGNGSTGITRTYIGTLNKGTIDYTLISSDEWHLLGNPYPAPLSLSAFQAANNTSVRSTFYFFNEATGAYDTWSTSLNSGTGAATAHAGVAQGFFVEELNSSASQVSYTDAMRVNTANTFLKTAQEENTALLKIQLNNIQTLIAWNNMASDDEDINDAHYIQGTATSGFYSLLNDKAHTIQAINNDFTSKIIPLGFYALEGGLNTIAIADFSSDENIEVILIDSYEKLTHDLNAGAYEFMAEISEEMIDDRFEIVLAKTSLSANENEVLASGLIVSGGNALHVTSENTLSYVRIYDITGALVHETKKINQDKFHWDAAQAVGLYMIEVATEEFTSNHKVILK